MTMDHEIDIYEYPENTNVKSNNYLVQLANDAMGTNEQIVALTKLINKLQAKMHEMDHELNTLRELSEQTMSWMDLMTSIGYSPSDIKENLPYYKHMIYEQRVLTFFKKQYPENLPLSKSFVTATYIEQLTNLASLAGIELYTDKFWVILLAPSKKLEFTAGSTQYTINLTDVSVDIGVKQQDDTATTLSRLYFSRTKDIKSNLLGIMYTDQGLFSVNFDSTSLKTHECLLSFDDIVNLLQVLDGKISITESGIPNELAHDMARRIVTWMSSQFQNHIALDPSSAMGTLGVLAAENVRDNVPYAEKMEILIPDATNLVIIRRSLDLGQAAINAFRIPIEPIFPYLVDECNEVYLAGHDGKPPNLLTTINTDFVSIDEATARLTVGQTDTPMNISITLMLDGINVPHVGRLYLEPTSVELGPMKTTSVFYDVVSASSDSDDNVTIVPYLVCDSSPSIHVSYRVGLRLKLEIPSERFELSSNNQGTLTFKYNAKEYRLDYVVSYETFSADSGLMLTTDVFYEQLEFDAGLHVEPLNDGLVCYAVKDNVNFDRFGPLAMIKDWCRENVNHALFVQNTYVKFTTRRTGRMSVDGCPPVVKDHMAGNNAIYIVPHGYYACATEYYNIALNFSLDQYQYVNNTIEASLVQRRTHGSSSGLHMSSSIWQAHVPTYCKLLKPLLSEHPISLSGTPTLPPTIFPAMSFSTTSLRVPNSVVAPENVVIKFNSLQNDIARLYGFVQRMSEVLQTHDDRINFLLKWQHELNASMQKHADGNDSFLSTFGQFIMVASASVGMIYPILGIFGTLVGEAMSAIPKVEQGDYVDAIMDIVTAVVVGGYGLYDHLDLRMSWFKSEEFSIPVEDMDIMKSVGTSILRYEEAADSSMSSMIDMSRAFTLNVMDWTDVPDLEYTGFELKEIFNFIKPRESLSEHDITAWVYYKCRKDQVIVYEINTSENKLEIEKRDITSFGLTYGDVVQHVLFSFLSAHHCRSRRVTPQSGLYSLITLVPWFGNDFKRCGFDQDSIKWLRYLSTDPSARELSKMLL